MNNLTITDGLCSANVTVDNINIWNNVIIEANMFYTERKNKKKSKECLRKLRKYVH